MRLALPLFDGVTKAELHVGAGDPVGHWYNGEHRQSGIGYLTPEDLHYGRGQIIRDRRKEVLAKNYEAHPERFRQGAPEPPRLPRPSGSTSHPPQRTGLFKMRIPKCLI